MSSIKVSSRTNCIVLVIGIAVAMSGCSQPPQQQMTSSSTSSRPTTAQEPKISFRTEPVRPQKGKQTKLYVSVQDVAGNTFTDAEVKLTLTMDAMPSMNMQAMKETVQLARLGAEYAGRIKLPMVGLWGVSVEVMRQDKMVATYRDTISVQ